MEKYQFQHTKTSSTHSIGNIDLSNNTKDGILLSMENIIPSEPQNERSIFSRENVVLCDICCGENVKLSKLHPSGMGSRVQSAQLDPVSSCVSDNREKIHGDCPKCTGSHGIHSSKGDFSKCICDKWRQMQEDYREYMGSQKEDSSKCFMDLPNACWITGRQSQDSLSGRNHCLTRCSQTRPLTYCNPNVINHQTQNERESIANTFHKRTEEYPEDTLHRSSATLPCTQKNRYSHSKSGKLTVFQPLDTEQLTQGSQEFTEKLSDKQPFQASTKCSSEIPTCSLVTSQSSILPIVTSFQDKVSPQQKTLPLQCKISQCHVSGMNPALFLYHSAVTLLNRTRSSSVFTNSLLILLFMFTLLPLHTHSATNGIPCLYKGSLKSDRSWFGFLTNITIMNTGRMTFQFSYPAEKCCQNILFYLEDQVSILNARMNCWQKESLLRYSLPKIICAI